MRFTELSQHAVILISSEEERVKRLIYGLYHGIHVAMVIEVKSRTSFHYAVEIAHHIEHIPSQT